MVSQVSACLAAKTERTPTGVRHRWLTSHAGMLIMEAPMRNDENASSPNGKTSREFYPELSDEAAFWDSLYSLEKTRMEEEAEEGRRKTEIWHIFETW
jgi:hypothetical protein